MKFGKHEIYKMRRELQEASRFSYKWLSHVSHRVKIAGETLMTNVEINKVLQVKFFSDIDVNGNVNPKITLKNV
jgi:hypothetical protein